MAKDDDEELGKAEPSRWQADRTGGHIPTYSASKLRTLAASGLGELQAMQTRVARMMRVNSSEDPRLRPPPHVVTSQDVTRGLGLDNEDTQRLERLVEDTNPTFTQKTQTQRIMHARQRFNSVVGAMPHIDADTRGELQRRAVAFWKRNAQTDYGKEPTVRFRGGAMQKSTGPIPILTISRLVSTDQLEKAARGGKYYRRVPTGNPKRPWRYYYTKQEYDRAHGKDAHLHGPEQLSLFGERPKKGATKRPPTQAERVAARAKAAEAQRAAEREKRRKHAEAIAAGRASTKENVPHHIWADEVSLAAIRAGIPASWVNSDETKQRLHRMRQAGESIETAAELLIALGKNKQRQDASPEAANQRVLEQARAQAAEEFQYKRVRTEGEAKSQFENLIAWARKLLAPFEATNKPGHDPERHRAYDRVLKEARLLEGDAPFGETLTRIRSFSKDVSRMQSWGQYTDPDSPLRGLNPDADTKATAAAQREAVFQEKRQRDQAEREAVDAGEGQSFSVVMHRETKQILQTLASWANAVSLPITAAMHRALREGLVEGRVEGERVFEAKRTAKGDEWLASADKPTLTVPKERPKPKPEPGSAEHQREWQERTRREHEKLMAERAKKEPALVVPANKPASESNFETMPDIPAPPKPSGPVTRESLRERVRARLAEKWEKDEAVRAAIDRGADPEELGLQVFSPTGAPPGGWGAKPTYSEAELERRAKQRQERREAQLGAEVLREELKHAKFFHNDELTINGKRYRVKETDVSHAMNYPNSAKIARVVTLEPVGRGKNIRQLYIRPNGQGELHSMGRTRNADFVRTIEGHKLGGKVNPLHSDEAEAQRKADKERRAEEAKKRREKQEREKYEREQEKKRKKKEERARKAAEAAEQRAAQERERAKGTPRGEASEETARRKAERTEFGERNSKFMPIGKKQLFSKKHVATFRDLNDALGAADADEIFTRKTLSKDQPSKVPGRIADGLVGPISGLMMHLCESRFPAKTKDLWHRGVKVSAETNRTAYYEAWQEVRRIFDYELTAKGGEKIVGRTTMDMARNVRDALLRAMPGRRAFEYGSSTATALDQKDEVKREYLRQMANAVVGRGKTGPSARLSEFVKKFNETYPDIGGEERNEALREHALDIVNGKSLNKTFGTVQGREGYTVNIRDMYDTKVMRRRGPPSRVVQGTDAVETGRNAEHVLKKAIGDGHLASVDYGNYVTDEERAHHLKAFVDSMDDLTDMMGLPPSMVGYNGKLGVAFGARGEAGALAHYEPGAKIINLTRHKGAGSLAHEWGHFFDFEVGRADGDGAPVSLGSGAHPVRLASQALFASPAMGDFKKRLGGVLDEGVGGKKFKPKEKAYWQSTTEVFARCFERYMQRKLQKAGRVNTYLVSVKKEAGGRSGLWPTDEEVDAMGPHFESLFEAFRNSELLHKAFGVARVRPEYAHLVRGQFIIPRGH